MVGRSQVVIFLFSSKNCPINGHLSPVILFNSKSKPLKSFHIHHFGSFPSLHSPKESLKAIFVFFDWLVYFCAKIFFFLYYQKKGNSQKMENNKKTLVGSTPSLTSQLFGSKESSSSNDVFASIFPPSTGVGKNSGSEVTGSWQKEPTEIGNQPWNSRQDNMYRHGDTTYSSSGSKDRNSVYHQERAEPCNLSSSLYYGGQESYSNSTTHSTSSSYSTFKKDGGEDDSNGAARGNWWQGSLYY